MPLRTLGATTNARTVVVPPIPAAVTAVDPATLADKVAWFNAATLGASGSSVATWPDAYGLHDLTQSTGALQPTVQTVNGVKVVRFASNRRLSTAFTFTSVPQPITVAALVAFTTLPTATQMVLGTNLNGMLYGNANGSWSVQGGGLEIQTTLTPNTFFQTVVAVYNGSACRLRVNGVEVKPAANTGSAGIAQMFVGSNAFASGLFTGDIAEMFIVGHQSSDAEVASIEKYLNNKKADLAA